MSDILPRTQITTGLGVIRMFMGTGSLLAPIVGGKYVYIDNWGWCVQI